MSKWFIKCCESQGLPIPKTEVEFARDIGRKWRADYYFERNGKIVILEVNGGAFLPGGGRHTRGKGYKNDLEKLNDISARGYGLIQVLPDQLCKKSTFDLLKRHFNHG